MALIQKRELVRPVRIEQKCDCAGVVGGTSLISNGMMAGHPPRYIYSCPRCCATYYFDKPSVTIQYERTGEDYEQG